MLAYHTEMTGAGELKMELYCQHATQTSWFPLFARTLCIESADTGEFQLGPPLKERAPLIGETIHCFASTHQTNQELPNWMTPALALC